MAATPTKKRKENWSRSETEELRAAFIEGQETIEGRFSSSVSARDKDLAWMEVLRRVNAQGTTQRTLAECRKKISDMKSSVKKRERERRQASSGTGGGPSVTLDTWEEELLAVIGEASIGGFGGTDTFGATETLVHRKKVEPVTTRVPDFSFTVPKSTDNWSRDGSNGSINQASTSSAGFKVPRRISEECTPPKKSRSNKGQCSFPKFVYHQ